MRGSLEAGKERKQNGVEKTKLAGEAVLRLETLLPGLHREQVEVRGSPWRTGASAMDTASARKEGHPSPTSAKVGQSQDAQSSLSA